MDNELKAWQKETSPMLKSTNKAITMLTDQSSTKIASLKINMKKTHIIVGEIIIANGATVFNVCQTPF